MKKILTIVLAFFIAFSPHVFAHEVAVTTHTTVTVPINENIRSCLNEYNRNKEKIESNQKEKKAFRLKLLNSLDKVMTSKQWDDLINDSQKQVNEHEQIFVTSMTKTKNMRFDMDEVIATTACVQTLIDCYPNINSFVEKNNFLTFDLTFVVEIDDDELVNELTQKNAKLSAEKEMYKDKADYAEKSYDELNKQQVNPVSVNDTNAGNLIKLANQSYTLDNFNQAIQYAQQASLNCESGSQEWEQAQTILAKAYMMKGEFDTSLTYINSVLDNNVYNYDARILRMRINFYKAIDKSYFNKDNVELTNNYGETMYCVADNDIYIRDIFPIANNINGDYLWFKNLDYTKRKNMSDERKGNYMFYGNLGLCLLGKYLATGTVGGYGHFDNNLPLDVCNVITGFRFLHNLFWRYTDESDRCFIWDEDMVNYSSINADSKPRANPYCVRGSAISAHDCISKGTRDSLLLNFLEYYFVDCPRHRHIDSNINGTVAEKKATLLSSANQHPNRYFNKKIIVMLNNLDV